jgi:FkbM family methyltransferase
LWPAKAGSFVTCKVTRAIAAIRSVQVNVRRGLRGSIRTAASLARKLGVLEGSRITVALTRGAPIVSFTDRGKRYWIAVDQSTTYHLLHNIEPLRRLAAFVRAEDQTIVDVGAHSGLFSAFALDRAPTARLIVVEPDPSLGAAIELNLRHSANWRLVEKAIGASAGRANFHRSRASTQTSSLLRGAVEPYGRDIDSFEVDVTTLDDLLGSVPRVDVLKVDVQGAESLVIRGGEKSLARVRTLLVEVSLLGPDSGALLQMLQAEFGQPARVNVVAGGADLVYEREVLTHRKLATE